MKKHSIVLRALLVAALLICATLALATSASAEATAESALSIEYANVAYQAKTRLAFTLKGTVAEGDTAGIAVWENGFTGEKTAENASYFSFEADTLDGKTFYLTDGIAADDMSYRISVAPCVKNSEGIVTLAGEAIEYSIYDYVKDRLDDEGVTDAQMKLYSNLVYYGNCAEKVIDGSVQLPLVVTKGGYVGNKTSAMLIADKNGEALIRANTVNAKGESFLYWSTPTGEEIYDRVAKVTPAAGNNVYTAVYGDRGASAYKDYTDLSAYALGKINIITDTSGAPTQTGDFYFYRQNHSYLNGLVKLIAISQVTSAEDKTVIDTTDLQIKEEDGLKYLYLDKKWNKSGTSTCLTLNNIGDKNDERIDLDLRFNSTPSIGMNIYFYFSDGTNNATVQLYAEYNSAGALTVYDYRASTSKNGRAAGTFARGEKINFTAEINDEGLAEIYVNGKLLTCETAEGEALTTFGIGDVSLDTTKEYATGFYIECHSGYYMQCDLLAVNFVDKDKFTN